MNFGVPYDRHPHEYRVGLNPFGVARLTNLGIHVYVESGAGAGSHFSDEDYTASGAEIVFSHEEIYLRSDVVCQVRYLDTEAVALLRPGSIVAAFHHLAVARKEVIKQLVEKEITASDDEPIIGELEMLTDGDKEGADGSFTEFGPGLQWVQVDLGDSYELFIVLVWHYHSQARIYHDVVAQISDDPDFVTGVTTIYNNDQDNSAGLGVGKSYEWIETNEGRVMDAKGAKGQYIRFYSDGSTSNDMNHYIEIEAYGRPAK